MPSTKCIELVEKRLSMFDLCLETDIVSIVTDGASVMTKVGKQIVADTGPAQQLCFAHGLQLAVRIYCMHTENVQMAKSFYL